MTDKEQLIASIIRDHWNLPDRVTDQEICEKSKGSFIWEQVNLQLAWADLVREIKESLPGWAKRFF